MGRLATSPLPSRGSLALQSRGKNQTWPTCGCLGYITPTGVLDAAERGTKPQVAHMWADWFHHPAVYGVPDTLEQRTKSGVAHICAD